MRKTLVLVVTGAALALSASPAAAKPMTSDELFANAAGQVGSIVWIWVDSKSPIGKYLRVGISSSAVGASAVLQEPENRGLFPNKRRAQQWKVERNFAADYEGAIRFRNVYSDKCLTAARPRGSPVYLQNCGSILGQAWAYQRNGMIWSMNYNQTFPAGCSCTTLDVTEFRNVPGTRLQVARHTGKWNQIWDIDVVPKSLR